MKKNYSPYSILFLFLIYLLSPNSIYSQSTTFTSSGSFTVPAGVTSVTVEAWGAGGSGGSRTNGNNVALAGGGGGAYAKSTIAVTAGASYTVTVGTGSTSTADGGDSWFVNATTILAKGGSSVANNSNTSGTGGLASASIGTIKYNGGNGATGAGGSFGGGGGSSAGTTAAGNYGNTTTNTQTGASAPTGGGNGGIGAQWNLAGANGVSPGGGGGGGYRAGGGSTETAGNGADGQIIISYTVPTPTITSLGSTSGCEGTSITINGTNLGGATSVQIGNTSVSSITSNSASQIIAVIGAGTSGSVSVTTAGGTATTATSFTVTRAATATAGTAITTCSTTGAVNITTGSSAAYHNGITWTSNGSGTFTNPTSLTNCTYTPSAADISAGSRILTLTATGNSPCGSVTSTKTITISSPSAVTAGTAISSCSTSGAVNITAGSSSTNSTSIAWTSSGSGTFTNATSITNCTYNPSATDISAGSITLTLTAFNTSCGNVTASKTMTITKAATAVAGNTISNCATVGAVNVTSGSSATNYTSVIWTSNGSGTFTNASSLTTCTYTPSAADIAAGSRTLTLTATGNSPCGTVSSTKTITFLSPIVNAGAASSAICQGDTSATLGGTFGGSATAATWSDGGIGGTFANNTGTTPNTATYTPPASFTGTVTLTLTSSGGSCGTATDSKSIAVNLQPTVSSGAALADICKGGTSAALGGSFGGSATGAIWTSAISGGTFTNNSGSTPNTTTWKPPTTFTGTATLTLTTTGSSCTNISTSKTLQVNVLPTASAGATVASICQGGTTAALQGSVGGSATQGVWTSSVGGTFSNNSGTTPDSATWTAPITFTGTAVLTLTTSGGSCGTTTASKNQTVTAGIPPTTATTGSAQTIYGTLVSNSLGGNTPLAGTGAWSKVSGVGTVTFTNTTTPTATATVSAYGAYVFRWTITNGSCGSSTADITVTYSPTKDPEFTISYDNFDNSNGGWTSSGTTGSWGYTNSASSVHVGEGGFWAVNTTSSRYSANSLTYLTSPTISTTGYKNVTLYLDVRYDTSNGVNSGMQIQYSINNGSTWLVLSNAVATTWYTASNVNALSGSLGSTNGWNNSNSSVTTSSQFEERSTTTSVLDNIANLKFRAVFASDASPTDAGVAIDNVMVKGDPIVPFSDPTYGPGSINSNLKLWLKSNAGTSTTTDGSSLSVWNDQAFNNHSTGLTGNSPVFRNNSSRNINFNPVVDFSAASTPVMKGKGGYWSQDYYVVVKTNGVIDNSTTARQVPISGRVATGSFVVDGTGFGFGDFTARYEDEMVSHNLSSIPTTPPADVKSYGRAYTSTTDSYDQETIIFNIKTNSNGTATEIYKNGKRIDNTTGQTVAANQTTFTGTMNFSELINSQYNLGVGRFTLNGNASSYLDGRMTEIITYSNPKSALEQQKIQSYLGIKNGITLHASNSTTANDLGDVNYIDSAGNIIWNVLNNNGYNYDIAGIGRDDSAQLNQKQSKTENSTSDISIGLGNLLDVNTNNSNTFDSNQKFLVWGNNHGTLAAQPAVVVNMSANISPALTTQVTFTSIGRTWKVVETGGDVATTKIAIPSVMLTATITPPGDFLMFISDTPVFDPTAEYRIMTVNGTNLETTYDFNGTKYITFGYAPEKTFVRSIKFNGTTDYLDAGKVLNLNTSFTVSAWVNPSAVNKTIFSKRDSAFTTGYELSINAAGKAQLSWMNSGTKRTITSNAVLPLGKWHHLGVIYNGTIAKFYVDGITVNSATLPTVPTNTQSFLIGAADGTTPTSFFSGWIDEVRVWNTALTEAQYRYVMNQEILKNSTLTNGSILPNTITKNDISAVPWSNLDAYYPMSTYTYTNAKDMSSNSYTAALRNIKTVDLQTAPLPHESQASGLWTAAATWLNNAVQDNPYSVSIEDTSKTIDWNIVKTSHAISSTGNKTLLGLIVNSNTLSADNNTKIELSHYLKLDGKIDLVDKSQLVQTEGSDLDVTSTGSIEKDQLGQGNKYNYNYWGSPVGKINSTQNNAAHSVADVMRDGTTTTPQTINWIGGYDGTTGTPISIAKYWLYKFDTSSNSYANWTQINETGSLRVGQGFTMKGNKGASTTQNYTFVGKPNNGTISSNSVGASQLLLAGNPYASSLDATAFINDNLSTIDGNIYFWEHYTTNSTHNLKDYQGGYAVRNLTGGAPASAALTSAISGSGTATKGTPNQFIPVGQGFFVYGKTGGGGTLVFKNSQRSFHKEDETGVSNATFRVSATAKTKNAEDNSNDVVVDADQYKKIRLGYTSAVNFHRQVLLGFMNEKATNNFDNGYDAYLFDSFPNDMTLYNNGIKLVIQGEGYFDSNATYPLAVKADQTGIVSFSVDGLENFDEKENFYILDKDSNTYTSIKENPFQISIDSGEYLNRFELTFKNGTETSTEQLSVNSPENKSNEIAIIHIQNSSSVSIENKTSDTIAKKVILYDMAGKVILTWETEKLNQESIQLPLTKIGAGVYIIAVQTNKGKISKQIIIR